METGESYRPPHPTREPGERRELPSGVWGRDLSRNKFGIFYSSQNLLVERKSNLFIDNYTGSTNKQINVNQLKYINQS